MSRYLLVLALSLACAVSTLMAQSASASLNITASVIKNCTINTSPVSFGNYDPVVANATRPLEGVGTVTVTCTKGSVAQLALNDGTNGVLGNRRLKVTTAPAFMSYELYKDSGRTQEWTDRGGGLLRLGPAPNNSPREITVYGSIPAGQDVLVGAYTDTVLATVDF